MNSRLHFIENYPNAPDLNKVDISRFLLGGLSSNTVKFLIEQDIWVEVLDYLQTEMEMQLRKNTAPQFWKWFKKSTDENHFQDKEDFKVPTISDGNHFGKCADTFTNAVRMLHTSFKQLFLYARRMDQLSAHLYSVNQVLETSSHS